ncbi:MAG TPA: hypothetical protein VEL51_21800 [Vicinamibacterales bacterium]|nr:hypothetical protein [Vicinamibacterales bacterium]
MALNLTPDAEHALKNYLAIILGYVELLLDEVEAGDPRKADFEEMKKAAAAAVALVSQNAEPRA